MPRIAPNRCVRTCKPSAHRRVVYNAKCEVVQYVDVRNLLLLQTEALSGEYGTFEKTNGTSAWIACACESVSGAIVSS